MYSIPENLAANLGLIWGHIGSGTPATVSGTNNAPTFNSSATISMLLVGDEEHDL